MLCGLARLIMCVAEVPFFYLSGPLIRRVGVRGVIALAQLAYLTRFVYYSVRLACASLPPAPRNTPLFGSGLSLSTVPSRLTPEYNGILCVP